MPRVTEKTKNRAGKDYTCGRCGKKIEPGERYLSWSFRYGGKHFRCMEHRPRPSELTQSKMSSVYGAVESAEDELHNTEFSELPSLVEQVQEVAQEVADEYREAAEPFGGEGENAERADELEGWADELSSFTLTVEEDDENALEEARAEVEEAIGGCPL